MKHILLCLMIVSGINAKAQRHRPPHPPRPSEVSFKKITPRQNVLTIKGNVGVYADFPGYGIGIEYERYLNGRGKLSCALLAGTYRNGLIEGKSDGVEHRFSGLYIAPGLRYHPTSNNHRVDFSIGAGALAGPCNDRQTFYYPATPHTDNVRSTLLAAIGGVYLNFYPGNAFVIGMHLEGGPSFGPAPLDGGILQLGIQIGARF